MKHPKPQETALTIVKAQNEIILHEISERGCWRARHGSKSCNNQDPKAGGGYEKFACASCRASKFLSRSK